MPPDQFIITLNAQWLNQISQLEHQRFTESWERTKTELTRLGYVIEIHKAHYSGVIHLHCERTHQYPAEIANSTTQPTMKNTYLITTLNTGMEQFTIAVSRANLGPLVHVLDASPAVSAFKVVDHEGCILTPSAFGWGAYDKWTVSFLPCFFSPPPPPTDPPAAP